MTKFSNGVSIFSDHRGQAAVLLAIMLVPVMMAISFAVDVSRQESANQHLQSAIDAASLAGARALEDASKSDAQIKTVATETFVANMETAFGDLVCEAATVDITRKTGLVTVGSACTLPTLFGGSFWKEEVAVANTSTAQAAITKLDLALMLDVTGSMEGQKLADLKVAAKDAAAKLITPRTGDRVRISFNTYAASVNAGLYAEKVFKDWEPGDSTCATEREGIAAWKSDAPRKRKWLGQRTSGCPNSSVLPLTTNLTLFNTEVDKLTASGPTAGHLGVAWAWYLISPEWNHVWPSASKPRAYTEDNVLKAVILMTDGDFNRQYGPGMGTSDSQSKKLCRKMRNEGILVYSVAFKAPAEGRAVLKNCAGDPDRFFNADNGDELKQAYDTIASQLSNLALVN
jgi:Flp pilus assembly protein TadG